VEFRRPLGLKEGEEKKGGGGPRNAVSPNVLVSCRGSGVRAAEGQGKREGGRGKEKVLGEVLWGETLELNILNAEAIAKRSAGKLLA